MDPHRPTATHLAVRDGRILAGGDSECARGGGVATVDDTLADKILLPGFVEGHSHTMEGSVWEFPYVGYFDRTDPNGVRWPGSKDIDAVVGRLRQAEAQLPDPEAPLLAWGFDPIYFDNRRLKAADLDRVSTTRPVLVMHASFHLLNVNSAILQRAGIHRDTPVKGVFKGDDGEPTGELMEMAAKFIALRAAGRNFYEGLNSPVALWRFGRSAWRVGITTAADLYNDLPEAAVEALVVATRAEDFPIRIVSAFIGGALPPSEGVAKWQQLLVHNHDRLRFGPIKLMTDGSIQGFTARLQWPGYYNGAPQGLWNLEPQQLFEVLHAFHAAGGQVHIHTNGDEASHLALEAIAAALQRTPRFDHRHTLQHCQMAPESQFRRMARLGTCVNLFSNHLYYWGDAHKALTLGPDRAHRMDAARTALACGVPLAIHSDAPVTPLGPLFTAWCAVNRRTARGEQLGDYECISVDDALRAITLGAAYTLKLDHEVGSLEVGKRADVAILEEDPLAVAPDTLKDVPVWGTMLGGRLMAQSDGQG
ncbi:MAG: amidohydrolase [Candidatus Competibacterales bacterium]